MSEITEKILKSGLIDKHTAKMMENFGMLPEGSAEKVGEVAKGQMAKMAEELAEAVEREHRIRETALDLDRPVVVGSLHNGRQGTPRRAVANRDARWNLA